ncbi:glycosyltransferase family 4 protein [Parabacteroides distasonis]|nr:glycosyltransferase family 4 protein [Parabacteroides distasonis]
MKKMIFCTGSYQTGKGGVASYARDFVDAFSSEYDIAIVTGDDGKDDLRKVYKCTPADFSEANARKLLDIIAETAPDIVINSNFALLAMVTPFLPDNVKVVTVSHFVNGPLLWDAAFNGEYADAIISLSSYGKENILNEFKLIDASKIAVVYNFMPPFDGVRDEKKSRKVLKIVYPGGSTIEKSSEVVCKAIKKLLKTSLEFELYWIGNIGLANAGLTFLPTKTIQDCLPKDSRIVHMGSVPREESKKIIADANVFLLPSRGEGFPITLIEAMRNSCIPIVSDAKHGSLDAISNGLNGFIVPQGDADAIFERLSDIIMHHENYGAIYDKSYAYYLQNLTDSVWRKRMAGILSIMPNHKKRKDRFDISLYRKSVNEYKQKMKWHRIIDGLKYVRHFLYFRYVRYFV